MTRWQPTLLEAPRAAALLALAEHRLAQGRYAQAAPLYQELHATKPGDGAILLHWGFCLEQLSELDAAVARYREALGMDPDFFEAHVDLAGVLWRVQEPAGALVHAQRAVALKPWDAHAVRMLGTALLHLNRCEEAETHLRRALDLRPGFGPARLDLALVLLLTGRLQEAWPLYAHRWEDSPGLVRPAFFQVALQWQGPQTQPLAGRRVLVFAEQGFGDVIQFIRYVALLQADGATVFAAVPPMLVTLLEGMPGLTCVKQDLCDSPDLTVAVDSQVALLDLPMHYQTSLPCIPAHVPYLVAPQPRLAHWHARLSPWQGQLRIGLAWAGHATQVNDRNRSMALSDFLPLIQVPQVQCFSLQKASGGAYTDIAPQRLLDFTAEWHDFADSAAQITNLDLVITVCSAVAHLAGALGKPVWVLLPPNADWRWLQGRGDSPWYPTMRLFRRDFGESRAQQVQRVLVALNELTAQPSPLLPPALTQ